MKDFQSESGRFYRTVYDSKSFLLLPDIYSGFKNIRKKRLNRSITFPSLIQKKRSPKADPGLADSKALHKA